MTAHGNSELSASSLRNSIWRSTGRIPRFCKYANGSMPDLTPAVDENDESLMPNYGPMVTYPQSRVVGSDFLALTEAPQGIFVLLYPDDRNEAALEELDFVDHLIDSNETDIFTLLMEDVKTPKSWRASGKRRCRPADRYRRHQSRPVRCRPTRRSLADCGACGACIPVTRLFERYGIIVGDDIKEIVDIASGFRIGVICARRQTDRHHRGRMAPAALWRIQRRLEASRFRCWMRRPAPKLMPTYLPMEHRKIQSRTAQAVRQVATPAQPDGHGCGERQCRDRNMFRPP